MAEKTWTVLEIIDWSRQYLAEKGFENARLETELLLGHALSLPRIELYLNYERQMKKEELERYKGLLRRRLKGEPVQYVTGVAAFMFSEFEVNSEVLIPRPETEALVEVALRLLGEDRRPGARSGVEPGRDGAAGGAARVIVDVGTGSGAIAVTMSQRVAGARTVATDSSPGALAVARRNAERAGVASKVEFLVGSLLEPVVAAGLGGRVSLLVSNPPYVASDDIESLPREVRDFEPRAALDGGPDGLDCLSVMAHDGPALLAPSGAIALEVGLGQASAVARMLEGRVGDVEVHKDYAGRERIVTGRKGA